VKDHGHLRLLTDAFKRQQAADSLGLISSPALLAELADVLGRPKFDAILKC
jgi:uncharacterized protein